MAVAKTNRSRVLPSDPGPKFVGLARGPKGRRLYYDPQTVQLVAAYARGAGSGIRRKAWNPATILRAVYDGDAGRIDDVLSAAIARGRRVESRFVSWTSAEST